MVADKNGRFCMDKDFCYCFKSKINGLYFNFVYFIVIYNNYKTGQSVMWWISWFCWISTLPSKNRSAGWTKHLLFLWSEWIIWEHLHLSVTNLSKYIPHSSSPVPEKHFPWKCSLFCGGGIVCGIYFFPASSGVEAGDPSVTLEPANSFTW